jgi:hypothetical protein
MPLSCSSAPQNTVPSVPVEPGSFTAPSPAQTFGALNAAQYAQVLACLIARGFGIAAICFFLMLTQTTLFDLIVQFGLPTPPDLPHRRAGGARAWTQAEHLLLITGWMLHWRVDYIAERLGRSRGSIYAKARRLGLPRRNRRALFRPEEPAAHDTASAPAILPTATAADSAAATPSPANTNISQEQPAVSAAAGMVRRKRQGAEIDWTPEMSREVAMRKWANQRNEVIASDFGISKSALTSHLYWLQIPKMPRATATDSYDPALARANIAAHGYEEVPCRSNPRYVYWRHRSRRERSRRDVNAGFYAMAA